MPAKVKPSGFEKFRTISELAALLGVSDRTVKRWKAEGGIPPPAHRTPGLNLWSPEQVTEILRRCLSDRESERRITYLGGRR